jgi:PAS domain S-box-containing protein
MDGADWLEALVEGSDNGLLVLGPDGRVMRANRAAERLTGLPCPAVIGQRASSLRARSDFPWSIVADAASRRTVVSVAHAGGSGAKLWVTCKPVLAPDDTLRCLVLTVSDVTEFGRLVTSLHRSRRESNLYRRALTRAEVRERHAGSVIGDGASLRAVRDLALKYAGVDSPVLVLGETGSGKGVFSRLIHEASARAAGPFLELNCGAIPEGLLEAELFGYARGAFTGADARGKAGLVELADGGTLLLDEIGDLPLGLQVKLLRFLEDGEIWPVGAVRSRRPNVRILAATNRDLEALMARGGFRRDLFYRLNVLTLRVPPLREHREDIPALVAMLLDRLASKLARRIVLTPAALALVTRRDFPGNVRELGNLIERLAVTAESDVIDVGDLPAEGATATSPGPADEIGSLRRALREVEADILRDALARYRSQAGAAAHLGVSQATIARRAKLYGLRAVRAEFPASPAGAVAQGLRKTISPK